MAGHADPSDSLYRETVVFYALVSDGSRSSVPITVSLGLD